MKRSCPAKPGHGEPCLPRISLVAFLLSSSQAPQEPKASVFWLFTEHQYPKIAFSPSLLLSKIFHQLSLVSAPAHPGLTTYLTRSGNRPHSLGPARPPGASPTLGPSLDTTPPNRGHLLTGDLFPLSPHHSPLQAISEILPPPFPLATHSSRLSRQHHHSSLHAHLQTLLPGSPHLSSPLLGLLRDPTSSDSLRQPTVRPRP